MSAEELAREFAALNAGIDRARGVLAELRDERAACRAEREALVGAKIDAKIDVESWVRELLEQAVTEQVDALGKQTAAAMERAVDRVGVTIDRYVDIALGRDRESLAKHDGETLDQALQRQRHAVGWSSTHRVGG